MKKTSFNCPNCGSKDVRVAQCLDCNTYFCANCGHGNPRNMSCQNCKSENVCRVFLYNGNIVRDTSTIPKKQKETPQETPQPTKTHINTYHCAVCNRETSKNNLYYFKGNGEKYNYLLCSNDCFNTVIDYGYVQVNEYGLTEEQQNNRIRSYVRVKYDHENLQCYLKTKEEQLFLKTNSKLISKHFYHKNLRWVNKKYKNYYAFNDNYLKYFTIIFNEYKEFSKYNNYFKFFVDRYINFKFLSNQISKLLSKLPKFILNQFINLLKVILKILKLILEFILAVVLGI
jgi:hypothetical protein